MEYKRLTERRGNSVIDKCGNCENVSNPQGCTNKKCYEIMKNRLAELEDKIEQGMLKELPCKVGDDVYFVAQNEEDWVMEIGYVFSISIDEEGIWIACRYSNGLPYWHNIKDGDVFFNANKANERLKELQNGQAKAN